MAVKALFLVVCRCCYVASGLERLVVEMANVFGLRFLSQLTALQSLRYQAGPLERRILSRLLRRSYGSVALVARGKDTVALRQRDGGRVQGMLGGNGIAARKNWIAGL